MKNLSKCQGIMIKQQEVIIQLFTVDEKYTIKNIVVSTNVASNTLLI